MVSPIPGSDLDRGPNSGPHRSKRAANPRYALPPLEHHAQDCFGSFRQETIRLSQTVGYKDWLIEKQEFRVASGLVTCYLKWQSNLHQRSNVNLRNDKVRTSERTPPDRKWIPSDTECSIRPWSHKHIRTNQKLRYVEVELHRNTKTSTNMGSPERKQNQGNEEKHTRKRAHVKAEVVHEDGTSSQPHRCNDDYRRELWNLRQEYAFAQAALNCANI